MNGGILGEKRGLLSYLGIVTERVNHRLRDFERVNSGTDNYDDGWHVLCNTPTTQALQKPLHSMQHPHPRTLPNPSFPDCV